MTELVFVHGWGFDPAFWDRLAPLLGDYPQRRIDLGFYTPNPQRHSEAVAQQQNPESSLKIGEKTVADFIPVVVQELASRVPRFNKNRPQRETACQLLSYDDYITDGQTGFRALPQGGIPEMTLSEVKPRSILIGHSLGFMAGILARDDWAACVAINGFARFVPDCAAREQVIAMRRRVASNPQRVLGDFYERMGAKDLPRPLGKPNPDHLARGLDMLLTGDIREQLIRQKTPRLVLASRNDRLVPLAAALDSAEGHDTAGHLLPWEDFAWCANRIKIFIENQGHKS